MSWHGHGFSSGSSASSHSRRQYAPPPGLPPPPPAWTSAPEHSYDYGQFNEASEHDWESAEKFCNAIKVEDSRMLPSEDIEKIRTGSNPWGLESPMQDPCFTGRKTFEGTIDNQSKNPSGNGLVTKVETTKECKDCCLISTLPILGGQYYRSPTNRGVYFELTIKKTNGVLAIGTVCRPYPEYRLPGWHRLSAALHLDDMRKFYQTPDGGQESGYWAAVGNRAPGPGDTIGCGYEFGTGGTLFFTFNGERLVPDAFKGLYPEAEKRDVYAAIGIDGENTFTVNFGGDYFQWKSANEGGWRLDGHIGRLTGRAPQLLVPLAAEDLPAYSVLVQ